MWDMVVFLRDNAVQVFFVFIPLISAVFFGTKYLLSLLIKSISEKIAKLIHGGGIDAGQADILIDDKTALQSIEYSGERRSGKIGSVSIGRICGSFQSGDVITPERLINLGLVSVDCRRVKILAGGKADKKLTVYADNFSLAAVKMILAAGGKVYKIGDAKDAEDAGERRRVSLS